MSFDFKKLPPQQRNLIIVLGVSALLVLITLCQSVFRGNYNPIGLAIYILLFNLFVGAVGLVYYFVSKKVKQAQALEAEGKFQEAMELYKNLQMYDDAKACWETIKEQKKAAAMNAEHEGFLEEALEIFREIDSKADIDRIEDKLFKFDNQEKLLKAQDYESSGKYDYAKVIYQDLGRLDDVDRMIRLNKIKKAKQFEAQGNYRNAAQIYEVLGLWEEAKRCMKLANQNKQ